MPIVQVSVWKGFGEERCGAVIRGITDIFVKMGIPEEAVEVLVYEVERSHWGIAGEPASERFKKGEP